MNASVRSSRHPHTARRAAVSKPQYFPAEGDMKSDLSCYTSTRLFDVDGGRYIGR